MKEYPISLFRSLNPVNDLKALMQTVKKKTDVIHCHSAKGGVIGRTAGWLPHTPTCYTPPPCLLVPLYSLEPEKENISCH